MAGAHRTGHIAWQATSSSPQLLLLHGFSDSAACWQPILPALARTRSALAVDARGHGHSGLPRESIDAYRHAVDAATVLDSLGLKNVDIIGHSMGALTAAALAGTRKDLVGKLILEDPPAGPAGARPKPGVPGWLQQMRDAGPDACAAQGRRDNPAWHSSEFAPWALAKQQFNPLYCDLIVGESPTLPELLAQVTCPVLILGGAPARGGMISARAADQCARAAGGPFTFRRIGTAGHNVRRDDRHLFVSETSQFLADR